MRVLQAIHSGQLVLCDVPLPCHVLEDGTRILDREALVHTFGLACASGPDGLDEADLSHAWTQENLEPFVYDGLRKASAVIEFTDGDGRVVHGQRAEILPGLCEVYLAAREDGELLSSQQATAHLAEQLVRKLARVGIVRRIDAALDYEAMDDRRPTAKEILALYLRDYRARWTKRFPDEYYEEIYRLNGWKWHGMSVNRRPIIGRFTNDLIYERITEGLLHQLRLKNPITADGEREHRHHQLLTDDFGVQELRDHIVGVIAIMRTVADPDPRRAWQKFCTRLQRSYPRKNTNYPLNF